MKIAIIGGGISGLVSAHLLHGDYEVTVFEANDYLGGHTHTVDVERGENRYAVDTGFIVFNEKTYPNFLTLITKLGVAYQPSRMTFSFRSEPDDREYSAHSLQDIVVPEPQHPISLTLKPEISFPVMFSSLGLSMLSTIEFNHDLSFKTCKIDDVFSYRLLTPEFKASKTFSAYTGPQYPFGIC